MTDRAKDSLVLLSPSLFLLNFFQYYRFDFIFIEGATVAFIVELSGVSGRIRKAE